MNNKTLCKVCKHADVCLFRRRVEKGEKHIINQIQSDSTGDDTTKKIIPTIKIGVVDCIYFGQRTNVVVDTPKKDKEKKNG